MKLKELLRNYQKKQIYFNYCFLKKEPKEYQKITKYQIILDIYEMYNSNPDFIKDICSTEELLLLKKILKGEVENIVITKKEETYERYNLLNSLEQKFLLSLDFFDPKIKVPEEIEKSIKIALKNFNKEELKERDELRYLIVGLIRTYFLLTRDEFFQYFSEYYSLSYVDLNNYIDNNLYFKRFITKLPDDYYLSKEYEIYLEVITNERKKKNSSFFHLYKKEELISVGKNRINLEDEDINKFYNFLLKKIKGNIILEHSIDYFIEIAIAFDIKNVTKYLEFILSFITDEKEISNAMLQIIIKAYNKFPNWINNGVAPFYALEETKNDNDSIINVIPSNKIGRNDPCPCGSGKKYKKCCLNLKGLRKKEAILPEEEAIKFYKIFSLLCFFANKKYKILEDIKEVEDLFNSNGTLKTEKVALIREKMWSDDKIIQEFIENSKEILSQEELLIAESWQRRISKRFLLYKYIDGKSILIDENQVYEVLGIYNSISEKMPFSKLPMFVEMTLLPFKDKIIYDGLFSVLNMILGDGIKDLSNQIYEKQKNNIIVRL
ncbi:MAG: YecA family protein [Bacilli bacterium]|jgi:hypothetical protein